MAKSPIRSAIARLNIQLAPKANTKVILQNLQNVLGVRKVEQTLPGVDDADLARYYTLDVDDSAVDTIQKQLKKNDALLSVELAAPRKLIR